MLGVEVGSPPEGGDGRFGYVRNAAWGTLTRHPRDPHAAAPGNGLGELGIDRAHAATPQAMTLGTFHAPVQFRRVSGAEVLSQSQFEIPLSRPTPGTEALVPINMMKADPTEPVQLAETAPQAEAAAGTLWGRGTASGFDGRPKDDLLMDSNVFTGYLGLDHRLQPNVLLGLAVAHSQGDVDYEARDVTKGDVDITLTSVLPYAHWSPRPGLGVWDRFGAGWGDLKLRDKAGKVKTDLEMLMAAVDARQELLTWRQINVAVKADAFLRELEAGADDRLPKTAGDAQWLRLILEGRTIWAMSEESHLTPIFEVGGRQDGGKAETGVGAETGRRLRVRAHTDRVRDRSARAVLTGAPEVGVRRVGWEPDVEARSRRGETRPVAGPVTGLGRGSESNRATVGRADVLRAGGETGTKPGL